MRPILPCLAAAAASVLLVLDPAHADDNSAQAEALFNQAKQQMAAGKVAEACKGFAASERLEASPSTEMNLADCHEKNNELASAWAAYVTVQHKVTGDGRYGRMADIAKAHADALLPRLSYLTINVPDGVRVEGLEVMRDGVVIEAGAWNQALPIDGGTHTITGRAPGVEPWTTTVTVASEGDKAQVEVPKFKAIRNPTGKTIVVEHTASPSTFTPRRKLAIGVATGGAAALIAGVAFGLASNRAADQAAAKCPEVTCSEFMEANRLDSLSRSRAMYADIGFGVGAAAVIGAGVLWLTGRPHRHAAEKAEPEVTAIIGARQVGAAVELHF